MLTSCLEAAGILLPPTPTPSRKWMDIPVVYCYSLWVIPIDVTYEAFSCVEMLHWTCFVLTTPPQKSTGREMKYEEEGTVYTAALRHKKMNYPAG